MLPEDVCGTLAAVSAPCEEVVIDASVCLISLHRLLQWLYWLATVAEMLHLQAGDHWVASED